MVGIKLEKAYDNLGFLEAKVYKIERPETNNSPLILYVGEGEIEDISITGNIKTKDYVILRELDLRDLNLKNQEISKNVFINVFTPFKQEILENNINQLNITICGSINLLNFVYYDLIDFVKKYKKNNNILKLKITIPAGGRSRDEVINYVNKNDLEDYFFFQNLTNLIDVFIQTIMDM